MTNTIPFYFDYSSPYGYLASERIKFLAAKHDRVVDWKPFLLGAVFKEEGTISLAQYPKKGPYSKNDIERTARWMDIPFTWPPSFPLMTHHAARATLWVKQEAPEALDEVVQALYHRVFASGVDISKKDAVLDALGMVGFDLDTVAHAIRSPEVKQLLRDETQSAIDIGVFGSPFMIIDGEAFWGCDRLHMMDDWLTKGGW